MSSFYARGSLTKRGPLMVSRAVQTDAPEPTAPIQASVTLAAPAASVTLAEPAASSSSQRARTVSTERTFTDSGGFSPPFHRSREATQYMIRRSIHERFFKAPVALPQKTLTLWETCKLAFRSLGIVYGDLGTSPLYVFPSISCAETPDEEDYLGILSLIFWTLTLIGVVKYTFIVMYADDHGEGSSPKPSLVSERDLTWECCRWDVRYVFLAVPTHRRGDAVQETEPLLRASGSPAHKLPLRVGREETEPSKDMAGESQACSAGPLAGCHAGHLHVHRRWSSHSCHLRLYMMCLWMQYYQLLEASKLSSRAYRKYGTDKVAFLFSPIMALWLLTTPLVGIYNVHKFHPSVFKGLSPHFIYRLFQRNGKEGWQFLGGVVLSITGSEAMFADLGHFDRLSIQMAFSLVVYPAVILTYAGQTAYLIHHPDDYLEGFFRMIPRPIFWPMLAISTLAAIVASQGLITATFSIVKQSMALDFFPPVKVVHTSEDSEGQIYSPEVNWGLMVLCCAVVFGFQSGHGIGNAFGFAVVCVMIITTCLMAIIMLVIWETCWLWVLAFFTVFIVLEGCYLSAVLAKVPQGGWLSLSLSVLFTLVMISWNYGRQKKFEYEMKNKLSKKALGKVLESIGDMRVPGVCFFYTDLFHGVPPIVNHYVRNVRTLHQVLIFTTIRHIPVKTVLPAERFLVGRIGYKGVYRCVARYGYLDLLTSETTYFLDQVTQSLTEHIGTALDRDDNPDMTEEEGERMKEIEMIRVAKAAGAVYVLGRSEFKVDANTSCIDSVFAGMLYPFLQSICRSPVSSMHIPPSCFLEVGMKYDLL